LKTQNEALYNLLKMRSYIILALVLACVFVNVAAVERRHRHKHHRGRKEGPAVVEEKKDATVAPVDDKKAETAGAAPVLKKFAPVCSADNKAILYFVEVAADKTKNCDELLVKSAAPAPAKEEAKKDEVKPAADVKARFHKKDDVKPVDATTTPAPVEEKKAADAAPVKEGEAVVAAAVDCKTEVDQDVAGLVNVLESAKDA